MKRDRLYTVGGNIRTFGSKKTRECGCAGNIFDGGGLLEGAFVPQGFSASQLGTFTYPTLVSSNPLNGFRGIDPSRLPSKTKSSIDFGGTMSGIVSAISPMLTNAIGGGYSTGGVGEGISTVGNVVGDALGPVAGSIVKVGSAIVGGLANRAFGTKENKQNIAAIQNNSANLRNTGNVLAGASTTGDLLSSAGQMGGSMGFGSTDLVKGGWFSKGKAKRKAQKFLNEENSALSMQSQGLATGAERVDSIQDNNIMGNFAAFGGPLGFGYDDTMPAVDYDFMNSYLLNKQRQAEMKNKAGGINSLSANVFSNGGIEIKHPGRLTRLKERTGKTEAELWAEGKPEVRKMITFARNARKWSKALGGKIEKDGVIVPDNTRVDSPIILPIQAAPKFKFNQDYSTPNFGTVRYLGNDEFGQVIQKYLPERWEHRMTNKEKENFKKEYQEQLRKDKISNILRKKSFGGSLQEDTLFALGGDIQSNGADFTTGMSYINAGGSHEENPNQGVQVGVDKEGTPNLVEEGETIFNDYVYSNRITADEETKKKFHIGKKREITFADLSKKLEKEAAERPNDPISQAALQAQMADLAEHQERQKQEMEAQRAREAFEALSPEEQTAVMQQVAQQEQAVQEQAMQQEAVAQQAQQPTPEEATMMEQQQMADGSDAALGQEPQIMAEGTGMPVQQAYGGNLFSEGGGLEYLKKSHPELSETAATTLGSIMDRVMASNRGNYMTQGFFSGLPKEDYDKVWRSIMHSNNSIEGARKNIQNLVRLGMSEVDSYNIISSNITGRDQKDIEAQLHKDFQGKKSAYKESVQVSSPKRYRAKHEGKVYNTREEALEADKKYLEASYKAQRLAKTQKSKENNSPTTGVVPSVSTNNKDAQPVSSSGRNHTVRREKPSQQANGSNVRNVGDWKNPNENHWDIYTRPGFEAYIDNAIAQYNMAPDDATKRAIQDDFMNKVNSLQQSYNDIVAPNLGESSYAYRPEVKEHQTMFENLGGNQGFWPVQEDGSVINAIGNAINLPFGYSSGDNPSGRGIDGYEGPQTAQRHFGSTADGDAAYFTTFADKIRNGLNLTYAPNPAWSYGEDGKYQLYGVSRIESPNNASPQTGNTNYWKHVPEQPGWNKWSQPRTDNTSTPAATEVSEQTESSTTPTDRKHDIVPNYRNEKLRYVGLLGPAVGLGMQALGIGRPDTSRLDASLETLGNAHTADYRPLGNYLTYRPMDIWAAQNRANAQARATERQIMNSGASQGAKMAGLLASGYNDQLASGTLFRQAQEYNDNLRKQVTDFNRGTDQFNAEAYNRTSQFNADALNRNRQMRAQLSADIARQKMDADAGWYNGIYGNVAGLFRGISDLGTENYRHNRVADMMASGIVPINPDNFIANGYLKYGNNSKKSKGGKVRRRRLGL